MVSLSPSAGSPKACYQCRQCGNEFTRKKPSPARAANGERCLYCSRQCYFDAKKAMAIAAQKKRDAAGGGAELAASIGNWMHQWDRLHGRHLPPTPIAFCKRCSRSFSTSGLRGRRASYCSRECSFAERKERQCFACGETVLNAAPVARACCEACKKDAALVARRECRRRTRRLVGNHRRRCRTYGGRFNPAVTRLAVFKRDGFFCHICGQQTSEEYRHDDPRSPTIDHHPIPLSKGGDHDWHNVRCACSRCNAIKSDRMEDETSHAPQAPSRCSEDPQITNHPLAAEGRPQVFGGGGST
ncbi:MAG: phage Dante [Planctomycetota bacterium]|jgi:5-methylcytosine-specific restriction endonuclease McrA